MLARLGEGSFCYRAFKANQFCPSEENGWAMITLFSLNPHLYAAHKQAHPLPDTTLARA